MEWLAVTIGIYRRVFARAAALALRNWLVLGSVFAYAAIFYAAAFAAVFLGFAGGFLMGFVMAACAASFLYLVEMMVRTSRVSWQDFRGSFGVYLWDVIGVYFILWILRMAVPFVLQLPQGELVILCVGILIAVLFNAVPELIYLGHYSLMALLSESYRFIAENWVEWFPPNLLLLLIFAVLWQWPAPGPVADVLQTAVVALFVYFAMVVRGLLFLELSATTRRGRAFRHRAGGN